VRYEARPGPGEDPAERRRLLVGGLSALALLAILVGAAFVMFRSLVGGLVLLAAGVWVLWRASRRV
jgi:hypothetical protein